MANEVEVRVKVVSDAKGLDDVKRLGKDAETSFDGADRAGGRFTTTLKNIGTTAAGFIGAQIFGTGLSKATEFFTSSTAAASDVNESLSKVNTVFGQSGKAVESFAKDAAKNFGLSKGAALDAGGGFGNMFTQLGVGQGEAAKMSTGILGLAADFSSFHNADISEVIEAQSAAFRGEYDSVQKFVPLINAATVEQKALEMTGKAATKELTAQEKALAVNALMFEGAGAAAGDFARTSDGLANSQRIAAAEMENLKAEIGDKLMPVSLAITKAKMALASALADHVLPAMERVGAVIGPMISQGWDKLKTVLEKLQPIFDEVAGGWTALKAAFSAGDGDVTSAGFAGFMERIGNAAREVWDLLGQAVDQVKLFWNALTTGFTEDEGTPIERIALALRDFISFIWNEVVPRWVAFIGTIVEYWSSLYPKFIPVVEQVVSIVGSLVELVTAIIERLRPVFETLVAAISWIWTNWGDEIMAIIMRIWDAVIGIIQGALDIIQGIIRLVTALIQGDWSAAWDAFKQIVDGAWQIITSIISLAWDGIVALLQLGLDGLQALWENKWAILGAVAGLAWEAIKGIIGLAWEGIKALFGEFMDQLANIWAQKWEILATLATLGWELIKGLFVAAWEALKLLVVEGWDGIQDTFALAWEIIKAGVAAGWQAIQDAFALAWEIIKAGVSAGWQAIQDAFQLAWDAITALVSAAWDAIKLIFSTAFEFIKALVTGDWETVRQMTSDAWEAIKQLLTDAWEAIKTLITDALEAVKSTLSEAWESIKSTITSAMDTIRSVISDAWEAIKGVVSDAMATLKSTIEDAWNSVKSTVSDAMSAIQGTIEDAWNSIVSTVTSAASSIKGALSGLWDGITDGLGDKVNSAIGQINNLINAVNSIPLNPINVPNIPLVPRSGSSATAFSSSEFAHGGIVGAARGGIHGGWRMVGEHGPELIKLGAGSQVRSNPDTERDLARMGSGGAGGTLIVHVHGSVLSDRDLAEKLRDMLYAGDYASLT